MRILLTGFVCGLMLASAQQPELTANQKEILIWWIYADPKQTQIVVAVKNHTEELARMRVPINWSQPAKIAL